MQEGKLKDLWNDTRFMNLRSAFIRGEKPRECSACWDEEAAGLPSFRTSFVKDKKIDIEKIELVEYARVGPVALDLKLNNVCNLKCRICGPQASSQYVKEHQDRYGVILQDSRYWLSNKIVGTENEDIFNEWANNLQHLEMTGGEPFASSENLKIIELLIQTGNANNISLVINTNGTHFNSKTLTLLAHFKSVILLLSIDDIEKRFEYQRYPAIWGNVIDNIHKFIEYQGEHNNIQCILFPTVSNYNIFYLPEYLEWSNALNMPVVFNILHYSPSKCIKNLPYGIKDILNSRLNRQEFHKIKEFLNLDGDSGGSFSKFIEETINMDSYRKQNFLNTFDIWGKLIMDFNKNE
jgi:MoaA/NifB/PqqE/SkfB family radical SAM enzyme